MKKINVAIDGPAGAGKSSIAKKIAVSRGMIYVDTGALYRSIALFKIQNNLTMEQLISQLDNINVSLVYKDRTQHVYLNGLDVSDKIRTNEVSMGASEVSAEPEVRKFLLSLQRKIASENDVIMDGRDIGTVILPDADVKIYLTASSAARAKRRWLELKDKGNDVSVEDIEKDIIQRDYNDMHRETAPLKKADDAVVVDTSEMNFEQSCECIENIINSKINGDNKN